MRSRRAAVLRWLRAVPALAALGAGCEVLIDGELPSIRCADENQVGPPACPSGQICEGGACVELVSLGRTCRSDADCAEADFCLDLPLLEGGPAPVCSRQCCTSSDCDPDGAFVCWVPERGSGGFCRAGASVGRPEIGTAPTGAGCADEGRGCRSGVCAEGACTDTCCSDTNCAELGHTCQLVAGVSGGVAWECRPPREQDKERYLGSCAVDDDCASRACVDFRCTAPCCGSGACSGVVEMNGEERSVSCQEVERGPGWRTFRACAGTVPLDAVGAVGTSCTSGVECRGGDCPDDIGPEPICSDACCTDASCGDPALFRCRPYRTGASWALRCEPK